MDLRPDPQRRTNDKACVCSVGRTYTLCAIKTLSSLLLGEKQKKTLALKVLTRKFKHVRKIHKSVYSFFVLFISVRNK